MIFLKKNQPVKKVKRETGLGWKRFACPDIFLRLFSSAPWGSAQSFIRSPSGSKKPSYAQNTF